MSDRSTNDDWNLDGLTEWLTVVRAYQTCDKVLHRRLADIGVEEASDPEHEHAHGLRRSGGGRREARGAK